MIQLVYNLSVLQKDPAMKAQDLIDVLSKYPEHEVVLSSDAEGNDYSMFDGQPSIMYIEKSNTEARLESEDLLDEDSIYEDVDRNEEVDGVDPLQNFKPVIVFYPI